MSSRGRRRSSRDASPSRQSSSHNNPSNGNYRNRSPERKDIENPSCKYGDGCYRKNPEHLKGFFHTHLFLDEIVNKLKILDDKFEIGEQIIDPEFENINDNNDKKLKEFIIYCIQNFEKIVKKYNIRDLIFIFMQFDARNASRTLEVCDNRIMNIEKRMKGNSFYDDINNPERKKNKDCIHINSSCVLVLLQDYQKQQLKVQEHKTPGGKRKTYKRKSYKRKTYKKKNKKNRSVKNRRI